MGVFDASELAMTVDVARCDPLRGDPQRPDRDRRRDERSRSSGPPTRPTSRPGSTSRARSSTRPAAMVAQSFSEPIHLGTLTSCRARDPGDATASSDWTRRRHRLQRRHARRHAPERRLPRRAGALDGTSVSARGGDRPPRRRRRRHARQHRPLRRRSSGGTDHPADAARAGRRGRRERVRPDPEQRPVAARDRRRPARPGRRREHRAPATARADRAARTEHARRGDERAPRLHRAPGSRARSPSMPHGTIEAEGFLDDDGITDEPVRIVVQVDLDADGVIFDLTGSDPQRPARSTRRTR